VLYVTYICMSVCVRLFVCVCVCARVCLSLLICRGDCAGKLNTNLTENIWASHCLYCQSLPLNRCRWSTKRLQKRQQYFEVQSVKNTLVKTETCWKRFRKKISDSNAGHQDNHLQRWHYREYISSVMPKCFIKLLFSTGAVVTTN